MGSVERRAVGARNGVSARGQSVVPVVSGGPESLNGGVQGEQLARRVIARFVGIEAAVDAVAASDQPAEPRGIGTHARRRDADSFGM